jgi:nitroreductase
MELFTAIRERRSCRSFSTDPVDEKTINHLLEAAGWAPSPLNAQPWQFIVVTGEGKRMAVFDEADRCRRWAVDKSGWKWLDAYSVEFLKKVPVIIAVVGDPKKTGVDMLQSDGTVGYQHACAAAIQNMLLAAHAMGLGSLWFTLFDRTAMGKIFEISENNTLIALVCIGKPEKPLTSVPRKDVTQKTVYLR